jgi:peptidoglycan/xylan/chitin deacetylase (PgdA/CDA1 family)
VKELSDTAAAIAAAAYGYDVRPYFRPPYGDLNDSVLRDVASAGYGVTVMWSCDTLGWNGASIERIIARCGTTAEAGDIILLHVGENSLDAAALPQLIELLQDAGFVFVTVEQLLQP